MDYNGRSVVNPSVGLISVLYFLQLISLLVFVGERDLEVAKACFNHQFQGVRVDVLQILTND